MQIKTLIFIGCITLLISIGITKVMDLIIINRNIHATMDCMNGSMKTTLGQFGIQLRKS